MGFFDDVGNWLGDITGMNQSKQGNSAKNQGLGNMQAGSLEAGKIAQKGAGQFAGEAGQAGQALGEQMGRTAATEGSQAATQAARTAGVNKGQAALLGGQEAGRAFTRGQTEGQGLGMGAYGQGAQTQLGGAATQGQIGSNQFGGGQGSQSAGTSAAGGLLGAIGSLFSDEEVKEDVKPAPDINEIIKKIKPVAFDYKPEMGQGDGEHIGVTAQDLEKTPLKENVVNTPAGKMINPAKQENSNLDLIIQLATEVSRLRKGAK